jgi:hypothetical protein
MLAVTYTAMFAVRHRARSFLGRDRMQGAGPLKTRSVTTMAQKCGRMSAGMKKADPAT